MTFKYWRETIASLTPNPSSQGYNERRQQLEIPAFITNRVQTRDSKTHQEVPTYDVVRHQQRGGEHRGMCLGRRSPLRVPSTFGPDDTLAQVSPLPGHT